MHKALVVYASRHGSTRGIAERIGDVLRADGLEAEVHSADRARDVGSADAFVIGSGVYIGSWLKEATQFIEDNEATLASRPVWLFSSGPLPDPKGAPEEDPLTRALGPEEGPGSGGHRKIAELSAAIHPREHRVFMGAYDPSDPPRSMSERFVRMMPMSKDILPSGDYRDWPAIEAWAHEIASEISAALRSPAGVA